MKKLKYIILLLQCFLIATSSAYARKRQVDEDKIIKEIWARTDMPEFSKREIDEKYKNEPAIGLAVYVGLDAHIGTAKPPVGLGAVFALKYNSLERFLIKLNSANAVEKYSEIEYKNKSQSAQTVVGVRVIKKDGTIVELNPNDYIKLDSNTKKKKRKKDYTKIAVPNLQIGDIIDYFIYYDCVDYDMKVSTTYIDYKSKYPVQSFRFKGNFEKNIRVRFSNSDKTADIKQSQDGRTLSIEISKKNIEKKKQTSFTSNRESPRIALSFENKAKKVYDDTKYAYNKELGIMERDSKDETPLLSNLINYYNLRNGNLIIQNVAKKILKNHFKRNPGLSDAQKADDIYNLLCYLYSTNSLTDVLPPFTELLTIYKIDKSVFFTTDRYAQPREYTIGMEEYITGVKVKCSGKVYLNPYESGFDYCFMATAYDGTPTIDGEKAFAVNCKKGKIKGKGEALAAGENITLPVTPAKQNKITFKINANLLDGDNASKMDVTREVALYGTSKVDFRYMLCPYWKYREKITQFYGINKSFEKECKDLKYDARSISSLTSSLDEDELSKKKAYEKEAKMYFRGDVKDVRNFKILSYGVTRKDSILKYKSTATVEDMVMTAGKDKVVSIGRLLYDGSNTRLNAEEEHGNIYRSKTYLDSYEINIAIPNGFTAKDITSLNQEIKNECGMFKSTAQLLGSNLKITIDYENANVYFDKSKWSDMVKIINAYKAFRESSIVLKAQ